MGREALLECVLPGGITDRAHHRSKLREQQTKLHFRRGMSAFSLIMVGEQPIIVGLAPVESVSKGIDAQDSMEPQRGFCCQARVPGKGLPCNIFGSVEGSSL